MSTATATPVDPAPTPRRRRRFVRRVVLAVVALVVVASGAAGAWWWTHPTLLVSPELGETGGLVRSEPAVGEDLWVEVAIVDLDDDQWITVTGTRVDTELRFRDPDRPDPTITTELLVCVGDAYAAERTTEEQDATGCLETRPLGPDERVDGRDGAESLLLRLRADGPGEFHLSGVDVTYRGDGALARRGTQRIPANLTIAVRR